MRVFCMNERIQMTMLCTYSLFFYEGEISFPMIMLCTGYLGVFVFFFSFPFYVGGGVCLFILIGNKNVCRIVTVSCFFVCRWKNILNVVYTHVSCNTAVQHIYIYIS
eukprot:TRINITY_DN2719_c0_g1_i7.p1 TRINITY_DN2719_c0_g1~~TRINITY_DN2719_c0_g1_i7.p1  ORF type:complete len:107 (-),score=3.60 TRINITY_DN2719_c0_g1_i7:484-804(-)